MKVKSFALRVVRALRAAVTSPEVVPAEKSLAVLIATRVLLSLGAGTGLVELVVHLINSV